METNISKILESEIRGTVARGWCHKENEKKEMDIDLAEAISLEVEKLFSEKLNEIIEGIPGKFFDLSDNTYEILIEQTQNVESYVQGYNDCLDKIQAYKNKIRL